VTLLTACQEAATELGMPIPSAVAASTSNAFARELLLHANRSAVALMKTHDWRELTTLGTLTGDGSTTAFDLPTGYDRMPKKVRVHSTASPQIDFRPVRDLDEWQYLQEGLYPTIPGSWIILGGQIQIYPAVDSGDTAQFYYISKLCVENESGTAKETFTADTDTFRLSERLLALSIVWRWRAQKRTDFAADLRNYEVALNEEVGADKGSRILVVGQQRVSSDLAYPGVLGGAGGNTLDADGWTLDEA